MEADLTTRAILHVDADTFFLAVHEREDPSLVGKAVALWQYNDVVCASALARRLGVTKHMTPKQAGALVEPAGGKLVHAYWRAWPGPRIWYGPYHAASRELFSALSNAIETVVPGSVLERASIDECYIELTKAVGGSLLRAESLAHSLLAAVRASGLTLPLSIGVGENKLCAKLASGRAKATRAADAAGGVWCARTEQETEALLTATPASKLPGLGPKRATLEAARVESVVDLRRFSLTELQRLLSLSEAAAALVARRCHGRDDEVVREVAPQSVTATSWLARDWLVNVACTSARASAEDGLPVTVGGFVFEAHPRSTGKRKSDSSRGRWVLLALALDLEERMCHHALLHRQQPLKMTVGWHASGATWGETKGARSRTVALPPNLFDEVVDTTMQSGSGEGGSGESHAELRVSVPFPSTARTASANPLAVSQSQSATLFVDAPHAEQQALLAQPTGYGRRVSALVKAAATCLHAWAAETPDQRISQLTLNAHAFTSLAPPSGGLRAMLVKGIQAMASTPGGTIAQRDSEPHATTSPTASARTSTLPAASSASALHADDATDRGDGWGCRRCTLINAATVPRCIACDEPRLNRKRVGGASDASSSAGSPGAASFSRGASGKAAKSTALDRFVIHGPPGRRA